MDSVFFFDRLVSNKKKPLPPNPMPPFTPPSGQTPFCIALHFSCVCVCVCTSLYFFNDSSLKFPLAPPPLPSSSFVFF